MISKMMLRWTIRVLYVLSEMSILFLGSVLVKRGCGYWDVWEKLGEELEKGEI